MAKLLEYFASNKKGEILSFYLENKMMSMGSPTWHLKSAVNNILATNNSMLQHEKRQNV